MSARAVLAIALVACASPKPAPPGQTPRPIRGPSRPVAPLEPVSQDPSGLPVLQADVVGAPMRSARTWLTALAPNKRGGWNFITQTHEVTSSDPTEFFVIDLDTGKTTTTEDPAGEHGTTTIKTQLRAPNGRIFFPESDNYIAYYDPVDERVKMLGQILDPRGGDRTIFRMVFGPDGKLYGGTESNGLPTVFQLDPDTLKVRIIGHVGVHRLTYSYAYYLAADPPWLYVAVGENPWELVAINIETGVQKLLETRADNGFMQLDTRPQGVSATLVTGLKTPHVQREIVWCADAKTYPFHPPRDHVPLPFTPRNVIPVSNPIVGAPEIDTSSITPDATGQGKIRWRRATAAAWKEHPYGVKYTAGIDIESLVALPDGGVLGNLKQYHGFFRYDPKTDAITTFGAHGPSQGPRVVMNGLVYISGYPNGVLFAYDPSKPWTSTKAIGDTPGTSNVNPARLGNFTATATKHAYFLAPSRNRWLYYVGQRERDGFGSGIGVYDTVARTFAGHHQDLAMLDPRGLLVLDDLDRVVLSGQLRDAPGQAQQAPAEARLVVYDRQLHELERDEVKPGLHSTGELFHASGKGVIVGLVHEAPAAVYRYDLASHKLLAWAELGGKVGPAIQRASDGSIWAVTPQGLMRIDPETLGHVVVGRFEGLGGEPEHLAIQGDTLYLSVHDQLRRVTLPK